MLIKRAFKGPRMGRPGYEAGDLAELRAQGAQGGCLKPYRSRGRCSALDLSGIPDFIRE